MTGAGGRRRPPPTPAGARPGHDQAPGGRVPLATGPDRPGVPPGSDGPATGLLTDHYELTMLDAALRAGVADAPSTFEVFSRRLPPGRTAGVVAGLGRLLDAVGAHHFDDGALGWLDDHRVVSAGTLAWLAGHRFGGSIHAYPEGDWYTAGSPVLAVTGAFGECVLLETLVLSVLNHDSAVASAASLLVAAAGDRPIIEMGSRRTDPEAAVAAARAAYLAGFASTSNLEAGRRHGVPTAGTSAHAFTLAFPDERAAFAAQVAALGPATTLLVDTYDTEVGIRNAVEVAGSGLGAVRIDSGDLADEARRARRLLDDLGATGTRIVVTGDLDDAAIAGLAAAPVDGYGVGTNVVTGLGAPTAGFVYKLVTVGGPNGVEHDVAKRSPGKASVGGRKEAWRVHLDHRPADWEGPEALPDGPVLADVVAVAGARTAPEGGRPLLRPVMEGGEVVAPVGLEEARAWHRGVRGERPAGEPLILLRT